MKNIILFTTIVFSLLSCNFNDKSDKEKAERQLKIENKEKVISDLVKKYNIPICLDTLDIDYSIEFQEKYLDDFLLVDEIEIQDIFIRDSVFYASLKVNFYPIFNIDFVVSQSDYKKLLNLGSYESDMDAILVVKVSNLRKFRLKIESEVEEGEYEDCSIDFQNSWDYFGKGEIIEIKIMQL